LLMGYTPARCHISPWNITVAGGFVFFRPWSRCGDFVGVCSETCEKTAVTPKISIQYPNGAWYNGVFV